MASITDIFSATLSIAFETNVASLSASNKSMRMRSTAPRRSRAILLLLVRPGKVETRYWCVFIIVYAKLLTVILG